MVSEKRDNLIVELFSIEGASSTGNRIAIDNNTWKLPVLPNNFRPIQIDCLLYRKRTKSMIVLTNDPIIGMIECYLDTDSGNISKYYKEAKIPKHLASYIYRQRTDDIFAFGGHYNGIYNDIRILSFGNKPTTMKWDR